MSCPPKLAKFILAIPELEFQWNFLLIDLVALAKRLLSMRPSDFLLSVWMGVRGCGWPSSSSVLCMGTTVLVFKNNAPSSASAADVMTLQIVVDRLRTAPLFEVFFVT